jgi:hypothetical protein
MTTNSVEELIRDLQRQSFFGTVEIKFESGRVVLLKKIETIKPTDWRDNRGRTNGGKEEK